MSHFSGNIWKYKKVMFHYRKDNRSFTCPREVKRQKWHQQNQVKVMLKVSVCLSIQPPIQPATQQSLLLQCESLTQVILGLLTMPMSLWPQLLPVTLAMEGLNILPFRLYISNLTRVAREILPDLGIKRFDWELVHPHYTFRFCRSVRQLSPLSVTTHH